MLIREGETPPGFGTRIARRRVSHGDGGRGLIALITQTKARLDGQPVTNDGDATLHQGFEGHHGHLQTSGKRKMKRTGESAGGGPPRLRNTRNWVTLPHSTAWVKEKGAGTRLRRPLCHLLRRSRGAFSTGGKKKRKKHRGRLRRDAEGGERFALFFKTFRNDKLETPQV